MLILLNTNLELKSGLRTKCWFYWTLRYSAVGLGMLILLNTNLELKSGLRTKCSPLSKGKVEDDLVWVLALVWRIFRTKSAGPGVSIASSGCRLPSAHLRPWLLALWFHKPCFRWEMFARSVVRRCPPKDIGEIIRKCVGRKWRWASACNMTNFI